MMDFVASQKGPIDAKPVRMSVLDELAEGAAPLLPRRDLQVGAYQAGALSGWSMGFTGIGFGGDPKPYTLNPKPQTLNP